MQLSAFSARRRMPARRVHPTVGRDLICDILGHDVAWQNRRLLPAAGHSCRK